jgi:predicted membrane protein
MNARLSSNAWLGIGLIVLGLLLFFQQLGWFSIGRALSLLWPLLLIYLGWTLYRQAQPAPAEASFGEVLRRSSLFGDFKLQSSSPNLRQVRLWSLFGDGEVDFRQAQLAPGATVDMVILFGDVDLYVPKGWRVDSGSLVMIGDLKAPSDGPPDAPRLRLSGLVFFGDVTVRAEE